MKKRLDIEDAKAMVASLLGKDVSVRLNRGRNKIKHYNGVLSEVHSNVFVVQLVNDLFDRLSCTYTDMVCGELQIRPQA